MLEPLKITGKEERKKERKKKEKRER